MDITNIADKIESTLTLIGNCRGELTRRRTEFLEAEDAYRKKKAITLLKLRNGTVGPFEGCSTDDVPVTLMPDLAKAICGVEKIRRDTAQLAYKDLYKGIEMLLSELSAWQSLYRHQDTQ